MEGKHPPSNKNTTIFERNQSSLWFQPIWKILVKLDQFPRDRGEHKNIWVATALVNELFIEFSKLLFRFLWVLTPFGFQFFAQLDQGLMHLRCKILVGTDL